MNNYQIQTTHGLVIGVFNAVSPSDAVRKYAKQQGFDSFEELSNYLGLIPEYEVRDFRIILGSKRRNPMKKKRWGRFEVVEHFNGYAVVDTVTGDEAWMGDGVDSVFYPGDTFTFGRAMSPGTKKFRKTWEDDLNLNEAETLAAYFPDQYDKEGG